jgi:hypothetical protein
VESAGGERAASAWSLLSLRSPLGQASLPPFAALSGRHSNPCSFPCSLRLRLPLRVVSRAPRPPLRRMPFAAKGPASRSCRLGAHTVRSSQVRSGPPGAAAAVASPSSLVRAVLALVAPRTPRRCRGVVRRCAPRVRSLRFLCPPAARAPLSAPHPRGACTPCKDKGHQGRTYALAARAWQGKRFRCQYALRFAARLMASLRATNL